MPYVERTVIAGPIREVVKMYTGRVHTSGAHRDPNSGHTCAAQQKVNDRKAEEQLRWKLNANFLPGDYHLVLHYYDKPVELEKAEADRKEFLKLLRKEFRKADLPWKYVACTEMKFATNAHHHIILPKCSLDMLLAVWEKVVGKNGGNISIKPLDRRGNHKKLAHYLVKETNETARKYRALGKRYKRFSCAQGMAIPEPKYRIISSGSWRKEPKPQKGYSLLKDDDGSYVREGIHEINGWPWQEHFEIWTGEGLPPQPRHRKKRGGV